LNHSVQFLSRPPLGQALASSAAAVIDDNKTDDDDFCDDFAVLPFIVFHFAIRRMEVRIMISGRRRRRRRRKRFYLVV
jgi:hypothetical protein